MLMERQEIRMRELSIYIHIPFCVRKCLYCDFLSFPVCDGINYVNQSPHAKNERISSYVNLLKKEICSVSAQYEEYRVVSVFFGGGTPSVLPLGAVSGIMERIGASYHLAKDAEITIEMNPDTVSEDKLREYGVCGVNRLSIGLQSADDEELARIGRIHDYRAFERAYETARRLGFGNINIDLMAALPGQSVADYERSLRTVAALSPEHISAYSLTLEEGTPLYENRESYRFPTEEEDREMYALTGRYLASCGYHRYEISNYAKDGYECRHNKVYWRRGNYAGFGPGAASMVENVRWSDPADMGQYRDYVQSMAARGGEETKREPSDFAPERQILTRQEQMEEYMFLGLRMMCGVDEGEFSLLFGARMEQVYGTVIDKLCADGLLTGERGRLWLTERGIDVSNYVMAQFLFDRV